MVGQDIVSNEIHYNPKTTVAADGDLFEYVEVHNTAQEPVNIGGFSFGQGVEFGFAPGTVVESGGYAVVASDAERFAERYGHEPTGQFVGRLSDGGETLTLLDAVGNLVDLVTYDDVAPWPAGADGNGAALALADPALDNSLARSWAPSRDADGTPGSANRVFAPGDVNGDGSVDASDVQAMLDKLVGNSHSPFFERVADITNDSRFSLADPVDLAQQLSS